jgi:putative phosphoesterase
MRIGILSDTHGLLRPQALEALRGSHHILHAGDVGSIDILDSLRHIAPVTAIRGNIDTSGPCASLPETEMLTLDGVTFYLVHSRDWLDLSPSAAGINVVVSGHSHKPSLETQREVLYLNPGSAGPRRFKLPVSIAQVEITNGKPEAKIIELQV